MSRRQIIRRPTLSYSGFTGRPSRAAQVHARQKVDRQAVIWKARSRGGSKKSYVKTRTFSRKASASGSKKGKPYHMGGNRNFNRKVREVVMSQLTADNSYILQYADKITGVGATNGPPVQCMWGINQITSTGIPAATYDNLLLDDPLILSQILNNILTGSSTVEFTRKTYEVECTMTNLETSVVELWEYRCKARRAQSAANTMDAVVRNGFADAVLGINAKATYQTVGATPFMNPRFTSQYKIVKVKKFMLSPGESKTFKYVFRRPKKYTQESIGVGNTTGSGTLIYNMLKNQQASLFVAQGTYAQNTAANAGYKVGIGNVAIGMVYKIRVHYSWITDSTIAQGTSNGIAGFSSGAGYAPVPPILVHPDSAIATTTYGGVTDIPTAVAAGLRVYDSNPQSDNAMPDVDED